MSDTTVDTTVDTENTDSSAVVLTEDEQLEFLQLRAQARKQAERAEKAKQERQRQNGRGTDPITGKERTAPVAFLVREATLLDNWVNNLTPEQLVQAMRDKFIPMVTALSTTPSTYLAAAFDTRRREMDAWQAGPPQQGNRKNK